MKRRTFLHATAATTAATAAAGQMPAAFADEDMSRAAARYFRHGIASGDPLPHRVVLWTRVTPNDRLVPGVGDGPQVRVGWQIARDVDFRHVVDHGTFTTGPARDYTVKVDAAGLAPGRAYYYRFIFNGEHSPVGRTLTAPDTRADVERLRFGVVSCSNLQAGYFSAYRHLADRDDLDAVLHLGDYLYEYGPGEYGYGHDDVDIRKHDPRHEMVSLADYRRRHAQYKHDRDLKRLHRKVPFITTWDDHETTNDAWRNGAENHQPETEGKFAIRRLRAHKAYDEWMPVRMGGSALTGDGDQIFRGFQFGKLMSLSMLDLRSYRSKQVSGADLGGIGDPDRTITGDRQMEWLKKRLRGVQSIWKVVGNPVMIAPVQIPPLELRTRRALAEVTGIEGPMVANEARAVESPTYNADQWDGYTADRRELFDHLRAFNIENAVFLTGDIHSAWACDLPIAAGSYPLTRTVGTEFVCTSVTSNNLDDILGVERRTLSKAVEAALQGLNRHVRYLNFDDHGYSIVTVTKRKLQMDYYRITDRADRNARSVHQASWATDVDSQRVHEAKGPMA